MSKLRAGVLGAGAFGRIHARKYSEDARVQFVGVYDPDDERATDLANTHSAESFASLDALLDAVDILTIASPPSFHGAAGERAIEAGKHVLVEKPIATDEPTGSRMVDKAARKKLILACGHQERLVFEAIGLLNAPERPKHIESVREGPWTGRSADVSVTLDLMVHDLDLVLALAAEPDIDGLEAKGTKVHGRTADAMEAFLVLGDTTAQFTASRVAIERKRRMRAVYPSGEVKIDFLARTFENTTSFPLNAAFAETRIGSDPLGANVSAFIDAVLGVSPRPVVTGGEALQVLHLALDVDRRSGLPSIS